MSAPRPLGQISDSARTGFGSCLDAVRTLDPTRPDPGPDPSLTAFRAGLSPTVDSPTLGFFTRELFQLLDSGVASVSDMRDGRPWPRPRIEAIRSLVEEYGEETCRLAAREAREIVQSQDRAPNVTGLFAKKCADVEAERESRREQIRRALA